MLTLDPMMIFRSEQHANNVLSTLARHHNAPTSTSPSTPSTNFTSRKYPRCPQSNPNPTLKSTVSHIFAPHDQYADNGTSL